MPFI
ncbi:5efa479f-a73f-437c-99ba-522358f93409 [Thermothielavioides terrestris]